MESDELSAEAVAAYLRRHRDVLDDFVAQHVDVATLQRWLVRLSLGTPSRPFPNETKSIAKMRDFHAKNNGVKPSSSTPPSETAMLADLENINLSTWKSGGHGDKWRLLRTLTDSLALQPEPSHILWQLASCVAAAVDADGFVLHTADAPDGRLSHFTSFQSGDGGEESNQGFVFRNDRRWTTPHQSVASYVAQHRQLLFVDDVRVADERFPDGSPCLQDGGVHLMAAPVVQSDGTLIAVMEFYRSAQRGFFVEKHETVAQSYLVWGTLALHYADVYHALFKQRDLHQFLLTVVKSIFQDMVSMDVLIAKVLDFAQKLVDAERASMFLVDHKSRELYSSYLNTGDAATDGNAIGTVRFPIGSGIAGQVALTGEVLNIPDAYSDPRFNRGVDQKTGFRTRTILCMPISIRGSVIGVVQMLNKRLGVFTSEDEASFEIFSGYCGLAIHHAKLYEQIRLSEQKYRVALEVLSYHSSCSDDEMSQVVSEPVLDQAPPGLDQFWFDQYSIDDMHKVRSSIFMFVDLFGLARFEMKSLARFCLTVRKNYRRVPYHNWTHGFAVANCMYSILKRESHIFDELERIALFVGSLCHDLDHRGKNNKFMLDTASPLANIYSTSTMEHHHFNQTVTILQQNGHNIFSKLDGHEYKQVLSNIKHCILATDLVQFFPSQRQLANLVDQDLFSINDRQHRYLLQAMTMTASDLCASSKPWDIQAETVKVIFEEFYEQGDEERQAGRTPIAMMDRTQVHLQPSSQVEFITNICIPCYGLLHRIVPDTKPLLDGVQTNLAIWKRLADENQERHSGP